jgi:hypothetical protein
MKFEPAVVKKSLLPQLMPLITQEPLMPALVAMALETTKSKNYLTKVEYNNLIWTYIKQVPFLIILPGRLPLPSLCLPKHSTS